MEHTIEPGEACPACSQRKPHPRKETSPVTRVRAYRVPINETDAHAEILEAAARHLGVFDKPYWQFKTYTFALVAVLQDASLEGVGEHNFQSS